MASHRERIMGDTRRFQIDYAGVIQKSDPMEPGGQFSI